MGGGNGQKSKMARERNLEKQKGAKGSQLDTNKKAMTIQIIAFGLPNGSHNIEPIAYMSGCDWFGRSNIIKFLGWINKPAAVCKVCMQTFMCTTSEVKCREHAEAKHPKTDLHQCFPHLKQ